jgi:hypothetical protein
MRGASSFSFDRANRDAVRLGFEPASVPLWLVALVAAAAAPSCVKLYASSLEKKARLRTERALASVGRGARGPEAHEYLIEQGRKEQAKRTER